MAQPRKYKAEVISIVNPIQNIFTIELRSGSGTFKYNPGQFLHLALDEYDPSSGWPESRCYSIQTPPSDTNIKITFSVKGKFTARMAEELKPRKIIDIKLPYGELFLEENLKDDVVFIAGGTGITPFLSLFNDPSFADYKDPFLYLGVRERSYNIYTKSLELAKEINSGLKIDIRYQETDGILDIENIYKKSKLNSTYFISGPQAMISSFRAIMISLGVAKAKIKSDDWE